MKQHRSGSRLTIIGVAAAALVLGHWVAYVLAYRQIRLRDAVLATSGHSYLAPVGKLAFILFFLSLANVVVEAFGRNAASRKRSTSLASMSVQMIAIQIIGFSALEVVERLVARAPVVEMFGHYTYVLGVIMQVVMALLAAVVIFVLARTAASVRQLMSLHRSRRCVVRNLHRAPSIFRIPLRPRLRSATGVRGPPILFPTNASVAGGAH